MKSASGLPSLFCATLTTLLRPLTLAMALFVAGCASPRMVPVDANAYWSGRMAIQVMKDPTESLSASFELQGSARAGEMIFLSPIGTSLAKLTWTPQLASLEQGSQRVEGASLQSLGTRLTGTELPITALFEWLAGRSADAPGWQVDLSSHAQGRITAERRLPAPATVLRIVLDR